MKTIKSLKDITTLEIGDKVVFGDLEYEVDRENGYFLGSSRHRNDKIFLKLNISKEDFIKNLGIATVDQDYVFPETKSLEALTAVVSALFKEYEKQNEFPKTWEEFCNRNPIKIRECIINFAGEICITKREGDARNTIIDKNYFVSKQEAEAFRALMQLRQLRKAYVKDWEPDWTKDTEIKYCIGFYNGQIRLANWGITSQVLSFPTFELAEQFLINFKDLIEIAKPLL